MVMALIATGCGASGDEPAGSTPLGSLEQSFREETCVTAPPTITFDGEGSFTSPAEYTTTDCAEAVIVDVDPFELNGTFTLRDVGGTLPTNAAECESLALFIEVFTEIAQDGEASDFVQLGIDERRAVFVPPSLCALPVINLRASTLAAALNRDEVEAAVKLRAVARSGSFNAIGGVTRAIEVSYTNP
jgi:hypothetical protein